MKKLIVTLVSMSSIFTRIYAQNTQYAYDKANRLIQIAYPDLSVKTYTYDADGNRITEGLSNVALPLQLQSFDAKKSGAEVFLSWATSQETNMDRFEVEYSSNGSVFSYLKTISAKGNSSTKSDYSSTHCCPA